MEGDIEEKLDTVFDDKSKAGTEAIAYLLNFYLGEGAGTLLVINGIRRGTSMQAPLEAFEKCLPLSGMEPLPTQLKGSGVLPNLVFDGFGSLKGISRTKPIARKG